MIVVFSFDDGRSDAYFSSSILDKYNLKGSYHITTGFIDGSFETDAFGKNRKPITVEELKKMKLKGHDISSHGDRHIMEREDFLTSLNKLKEWKLISDTCGFSVPNSNFTSDQLNAFINEGNNLSYVRVGRNKKCYTLINKVNYILYHFFHFQFAFNAFNKNNLINNFDKNKIHSIVVKNDTKGKNVINFLDKYKNTESIAVLMFHSITEKANDEWEYKSSDFENICKFVVQSKIENKTLEELAKGI